MAKSLTPLKIVSVSDQVAARIRSAILAGQFQEGEVLNIHELAQAFGVSNTPVRSALQTLAGDGLVMLRPNKGAVVIGMSARRVRDYYQVRTLLESGAAGYACHAAEQDVLRESFAAADECVRAGKWDEYVRCNHRFHQAIWEMSDNERLFGILSNMWNTSSRPRHSSEKDYVLYAHEEHREIYKAILQRDEELAVGRMRAHLERSMRDVMTYLTENDCAV